MTINQGVAADEDSNYWTKMTTVIRQEIQEYRSELDALTMKRTQMERKLKQVIIQSVAGICIGICICIIYMSATTGSRRSVNLFVYVVLVRLYKYMLVPTSADGFSSCAYKKTLMYVRTYRL